MAAEESSPGGGKKGGHSCFNPCASTDQPSKSMSDGRRRFRARRIDLAVVGSRAVVKPGWALIPFRFRNDVSELIIPQTDEELVFAFEQRSHGRLHGSIWIVGAGIV